MEEKNNTLGSRIFLIVEGDGTNYPNYECAKVSFEFDDPSELNGNNFFLSSPLFSVGDSNILPFGALYKDIKVAFIMLPSPFPFIARIKEKWKCHNKLWFTLGLANLVIIDESNSGTIDEIISYLKDENAINGYEIWDIEANKISNHLFVINEDRPSGAKKTFKLPKDVPNDIKFILSEYKISENFLLQASKRFAPHYFEDYLRIFKAAQGLVDDILALSTNQNEFSSSISNVEELSPELRERYLNDRQGRLIQFNSALSYVFNQTFSGTMPILDHPGIVRRHSLLGIGTATGALFELIKMLEGVFHQLKIEDVMESDYSIKAINESYLNSLTPNNHFVNSWVNDAKRELIRAQLVKSSNSDEEFFTRLSFYSGRLGFREYDLSATSAIQVLVESQSLEWNVINYTHEIIHNHVRIILEPIIQPYGKNLDLKKWLEPKLELYTNVKLNRHNGNLTYSEYFTISMINYCVNCKYFGGLSERFNSGRYTTHLANANSKGVDYYSPSIDEFMKSLERYYRDISEIFVHIIDFRYVYNGNINIYIQSLWSSWSTQPTVMSDIEQYLLRTLLVIATMNLKGSCSDRFHESIQRFKINMVSLAENKGCKNIFKVLNNTLDDDVVINQLKHRFTNSLPIADMVELFFVADIEHLLVERDDPLYLPKTSGEDLHDLKTGEFVNAEIKAKTIFALDQLHRTVKRENENVILNHDERLSSWLLLTLSSSNYA